MNGETLDHLVRFVAQLKPEDLDQTAFLDDFQELASSLLVEDLSALSDPKFSFEKTDRATSFAVGKQHLRRLQSLAEEVEQPSEPAYRVFRRETPLSGSIILGSQPSWAAGASPERTVGPIKSLDGRHFWFDFFPIIRLVPLYFPGEQEPALLFYVSKIIKLPWKTPYPLDEVISLFRGAQYTLQGSSLWVRADLLASGAPAKSYIGLTIESGQLVLSKKPQDVLGKLTLPAGATCSVSLTLSQPQTPYAPQGDTAKDVKEATLELPKNFAFHFSQQDQGIDSVGDAAWTLYGQHLSFKGDDQNPAFYDATLEGVGIPLIANDQQLCVQQSDSTFAQAGGGAAIEQSAWLLPVSTIDINQPTPAGGIGGLAVQASEGLFLTWRGLREGPVFLPHPWIVLSPGLLTIADLQAGNLYAHQRFLLWKDEDSLHRSSVELQYTDSFPLFYAADAQGAEVVMAQANGEAKLDRPVDVACNALEIRSKNSLLILSFTDAQQLVYLFDDNILVDNLDPNQPLPPQFPDPIALALRNALFTTTPVNGFLLFAELLDEEMVDVGHVLLVLGLYGLLPTLPDPYAANVGIFRQRADRRQKGTNVSMLLLSHISWQKAADEDPDPVDTSFLILPLGSAGTTLMASSVTQPPGAAVPSASSTASTVFPPLIEPEWDLRFERFYPEQFALLDVSTNADWMGVSLGWFNPKKVNPNDFVFHKIYGAQQTDDQTQNLFPLQVQGLDLTAEGRFVRAFTVPQISWEPLFNLTAPEVPGDPPPFFNFYPNDGGPTRLFNDNQERVPIAPLPKVDELLHYFNETSGGFTGALFTLPFGLKAFAEFNKKHDKWPDAKLGLNQHLFREGSLKGGLQIQADAPKRDKESAMFIGGTVQLNNVVLPNGDPTGASTLGFSVSEIFNGEFFVKTGGYGDRGVPLTRYEICGYGASTCSDWKNPKALFAETSQARFDVFIGRTAQEVIQVTSVIYPWAIRVVRTIVVFRVGSGYVYRYDTGWQAESPGVYDFSYSVKNHINPVASPFVFHPGLVAGVYNVRNIRETPDIPLFQRVWNKANDDTYIDEEGNQQKVDNATSPDFKSPTVKLQPVYFDADVDLAFVKSGAVQGKVPSKGMLGYVQLAPTGEPIADFLFRDLLREQLGSLGGPVDCLIDIGDNGQLMRVSRVDVNESIEAVGTDPLFVGAARGSVVLPKDGAWSVVQYQHGTGEVAPLPDAATVPLIRKGVLGNPPSPNDLLRLEQPMELLRNPLPSSLFFGFLQSTGTQKTLFRKPRYEDGGDELLSEMPDFVDAYRMLDSVGIFPNLNDTIPLNLGDYGVKIIEEGYHLVDESNPDKSFEQALPDGPWYIINEEFLKLYIEYDKRDKEGKKTSDGSLTFGINSAAQNPGEQWLSKLNDIGMVVDLGPLTRLMMIKGRFDAEKGSAPTFKQPELEFGDDLQPAIDILQILLLLNGEDYGEALSKGLEIAMSNSTDSWAYAFHARKEIPLVRFPPPLVQGPTDPLKLECSLSLGVYFNEVFSMTDNPQQLIPSAGAFLEFYGRLSVMCVSVGGATVYATGSVDLRLAADTKTGPSLLMKFGFGAEINVGLPVIGTVSLVYMVGVEIYLDNDGIVAGAFVLYKGRAEILGGIVTITIFMEAKGLIERPSNSNETTITAQMTFGLDISICWVINISFTKSVQVSRQIA